MLDDMNGKIKEIYSLKEMIADAISFEVEKLSN